MTARSPAWAGLLPKRRGSRLVFAMVALIILFLPLLALISLGSGHSIKDCPGYKVVNVRERPNGLTVDLNLAGDGCNVYGTDIEGLRLTVEYQTDKGLHVLITDADETVYQVPESVFPRPPTDPDTSSEDADLKFTYEADPFSFSIVRASNNEILFSSSRLIFESQFVRLRTSLPPNPNLYGLGEHSDSLRLNTTNYTRTLWNRDAYTIPPGTNLYGSHPVYVDHRGENGTHGVFLLNSNGMDIRIDSSDDEGQYLEYNILGGVLDFYFLAGPSPKDVSVQYAQVAGLPAMVPYWGFGFHQCRYGYRDIYEVAEVVQNYSLANIPLETMWTDIDYMDRRRVFTLDQERFPISKVRALVDYLHERNQQYIVMVDPAVAHADYPSFERGLEMDVFLRRENGELYQGAVWPGSTVFPDWFHPNVSTYWINEFASFFDSGEGIDIDALWIDMNEAANFCDWPCEDPVAFSETGNFPPEPPPVRDDPGTVPWLSGSSGDRRRYTKHMGQKIKRQENQQEGGGGKKLGLPNRNLIDPPYKIQSAAGSLSNKTIDTSIVHANGLAEYDTHNLYGTMMSSLSREAMLHRRPTKRPLVITRSTFAGAGSHVGHWLGDNASTWTHYLTSITQMLTFASIFQIPMVGSDACGFTSNTTEQLCARWTRLAAFNPFFRNHNEYGMAPQEFYRWASVAEAARRGIEIRYQLLDYLYTGFWRQSITGEPFLMPLFFVYPDDGRAVGIDAQFFYGDVLLISPVTEENSTAVEAYFPDDLFYDWYTDLPVQGHGEKIILTDIGYTDIPIHIRGGSIIPLRSRSANTTAELREQDFRLIVAPDGNGTAEGRLYVDDGESLEQAGILDVSFEYENGTVTVQGEFGFSTDLSIESVVVLGDGGGEWEVKLPLTGEGRVDLFNA